LLRFCLFAVVFSTFSIRAADQTELNGNINIFTITAAMAAVAEDASSLTPIQSRVREYVLAQKPPVVSELRNFFSSHRRRDAGADFGQYVSFALTSGEPPAFLPRFEGSEIPPDVQALEGFRQLIIRFYREADLERAWKQLEPEYEKELSKLNAPISKALLEANAYLRNPTSGYMGRRFLVNLDLLAPANQVQTRSYQDDYYIILGPSTEPRLYDVRHAYLHYLLDPLAIKFSERVEKSRGLIDYAQGAPLLAESYKTDYLLLVTESLIQAIESRVLQSKEKAQEALREGYVLAPFFTEQLPAYEKQETAMRMYFPELIGAIDLNKEARRLENVEFATTRKEMPSAPSPLVSREATGTSTPIDRAEQLYTGRELDKARDAYMQVLQTADKDFAHNRAYYGLARIAALQKNPKLAEELFHKTLETAPDPPTRAWSEIYLGRLAEAAGESAQAIRHYEAAAKVEGSSAGAKQAAEQSLQRLSNK
jgi:tetratricopeptide (TPR) repeat protein